MNKEGKINQENIFMKMKKVMLILFALALVSGAEAQSKFSSARSLLVKEQQEAALQQSRRAGQVEEQLVGCYIKFSAPCKKELKALGVKPQVVLDGLMTAQVPVGVMDQVAQLEQVTSIEIGQQLQKFTDAARKSTGAYEVLHGKDNGLTQNYDGAGVVMCVIDDGFDFQHPALRTADGHSRCSMVYLSGNKYVEGMGGEQPVINGEVLPGVVYTKQDEIDQLTTDLPNGSHGMHVVSTAAGREIGEYGGVAPGTDLVVCSVAGVVEQSVVSNCMAVAAQYAKKVGKRMVISRSIGFLVGPHDGTSLASKVDEMMAKENNFIICQSTANTGASNMYIHFKKDSLETITINGVQRKYYAMMVAPWSNTCKENKNVTMAADLWCSDDQPFDIAFVTYDNTKGLQFDTYNGFVKYEDNMTSVQGQTCFRRDCVLYDNLDNHTDSLIAIGLVSKGNNKYNLSLIWGLTTNNDENYVGKTPQIGIMIFPRNENQEIRAWVNAFNCTAVNVARDLKPGYSNPQNIKLMCGNSEISCCDDCASPYVISVGNYISKDKLTTLEGKEISVPGAVLNKINPESSYGTTLNGIVTPTVCGPGTVVVAAVNHYDTNFSNNQAASKSVTENGVTYYWAGMEGTSMSTPHVAGIMAQWLQANKNLTLDGIKNALKETSTPCADTDADKVRWGQYGRINALKGIKHILETSDIRDLQAEKALDAKGNVYNMNGQLVRSNVSGSDAVNGLPAGIYVVNGRKVVIK